jgi:nitrogen fixation protein NifU and related proteins
MVAVEKLYDDVILDHIKNARNYRKIENADREMEEFNPLCGDILNVYLRMRNEIIEDIAFQCTCCGISMASASIMTEKVKGRTKMDAHELSQKFVRLLERRGEEMTLEKENDTLAVLATIREFPSRISCATLAWKALERILAT